MRGKENNKFSNDNGKDGGMKMDIYPTVNPEKTNWIRVQTDHVSLAKSLPTKEEEEEDEEEEEEEVEEEEEEVHQRNRGRRVGVLVGEIVVEFSVAKVIGRVGGSSTSNGLSIVVVVVVVVVGLVVVVVVVVVDESRVFTLPDTISAVTVLVWYSEK
ncbi:hypothetical protein M0802_003771 [Mischocyttarus mexicanus]|nr:hypothetical protein M0802_003771 [Mischocyttarus mexicanus]